MLTDADKQAVSRFVTEFLTVTAPETATDYHGQLTVWLGNLGLVEDAALSARLAISRFAQMKGIPVFDRYATPEVQ